MVLADDVMVVASGTNVTHKFAKPLKAIHIHLHTLRAKIAPSKSYNFAISSHQGNGLPKHGGAKKMGSSRWLEI